VFPRVINVVDTNGVQAQFLESLDIPLATLGVSDRIMKLGGTTRLIVDTTDVKAIIALEEGISLDSDGNNAAVAVLDVCSSTEDGGSTQKDGHGHGGYGNLHNAVVCGAMKSMKRVTEIR
jgi:hypothetical protein